MKNKARDYEVRIWWSGRPGDECYIAQVVEWPAVMAHGDTREEAAHEIQEALTLSLTDAEEHGIPIPEPNLAYA